MFGAVEEGHADEGEFMSPLAVSNTSTRPRNVEFRGIESISRRHDIHLRQGISL
jgi:hypothetical protein